MKPLLLSICYLSILCFMYVEGLPKDDYHALEVKMPKANPQKVDDYLCTAVKIPSGKEKYVVRFEPQAKPKAAHHMLVYGCESVNEYDLQRRIWPCGGGICNNMKIMFAWAKKAPGLSLPDDVAFVISGDTDVQYIALQVHYQRPLSNDESGVVLKYTYQPPRYMAGIYLLVTGNIYIPPFTEEYHTDIICKSGVETPIHMFATRSHAHGLGTVISGYIYDQNNDTFQRFAKGNPMWPQTFYPMKKEQIVTSDDYVVGRCTYSSATKDKLTTIGAGGDDEMCNLYVMYYTDRKKGRSFYMCSGNALPINKRIPDDSLHPLPPNPILEEEAAGIEIPPEIKLEDEPTEEVHYNKILDSRRKKGHSLSRKRPALGMSDYYDFSDYDYPEEARSWNENQPAYTEVRDWPNTDMKLGQVTAVSQDYRGNIVVFHRGDRVWDGTSFNGSNYYRRKGQPPIPQDTVIMFHPNTSKIVHQWGKNLFYLPHGLTVDAKDNVWLTDVAMHQVFKFAPFGDGGSPKLTLGEAFIPGNDQSHFCKPTSVAVLANGEFFVADGYCNSRLMHYKPSGELKRVWSPEGNPQLGKTPPVSFNVAHKVFVMEPNHTACVADREAGRLVCVDYVDYESPVTKVISSDLIGTRLFSVSYSPQYGGILAAVNGPYGGAQVQGVILDYGSGKMLRTFHPENGSLSNPHDVFITRDARNIYVVEIGPNKIWKFQQVISEKEKQKKTQDSEDKKGNSTAEKINKEPTQAGLVGTASPIASIALEWGPATLVGILVIVPLVMIVVIATCIRSRRKNRVRISHLGQSKGLLTGNLKSYTGKFSLGNFMNGHKGFEKVKTEDSDHDDGDTSDSDVEEFSVTPKA